MEHSKVEARDFFEKVVLINEQVKSKPKTNLTQRLQEMINEAFFLGVSDGYKKLAEYQTKLATPIKQGIAEYLKLNPEKGEQKEDTIDLLLLFRESARANDQVQLLSTLSLWRHGHFEHGDDNLIKKWLCQNENSRKKVSLKIAELISAGDIHEKINMLNRCKEIVPELIESDWDESKLSLSNSLRELSMAEYGEDIAKELLLLEKFMGNSWWVDTTKDQVIISQIQAVRRKIESEAARPDRETEKPISIKMSQNSLLPMTVSEKTPFTENRPKDSSEQVIEQRPDSSSNQKAKKPVGEKQPFKQNGTKQFSEKPISGETISAEGLEPAQKKLIEEIIRELSSANKNLFQHKIAKGRLETSIQNLGKKNSDLMLENEIYAEENDKLAKKVQLLRDRLEEVNNKLEEERKLRKEELDKFGCNIDELSVKLEMCRSDLSKEKAALEKERQLSHATHRDAMYRADVELQTRLRQISQVVGPIFMEFEEFESVEGLNQHSRMILNVAKNLGNALKSKGVKL